MDKSLSKCFHILNQTDIRTENVRIKEESIKLTEIKVSDASSAKQTARRHLNTHYGREKLEDVVYTRVWYITGSEKDVYEVEGEAIIKTKDFDRATARFKRSSIRFKLLMDPVSGNLIELKV